MEWEKQCNKSCDSYVRCKENSDLISDCYREYILKRLYKAETKLKDVSIMYECGPGCRRGYCVKCSRFTRVIKTQKELKQLIKE